MCPPKRCTPGAPGSFGWVSVPKFMYTKRARNASPRSVLWMLRWPSSSRQLRLEAAAAGIHASRIVFVDRLPQGEHLCAFSLADVALDSPSYTSGATGIDVLWSGVPLLAMAGGMRPSRAADGERESTASNIFQRNSVSLLAAAALPAAEAYSSAGYVQLGLALASRAA